MDIRTGTQPRVLVGVFRNNENAEKAYNDLRDHGYSKDEINVIMTSETRERYYPARSGETSEMGTKALKGTGAGATIGGVLGGIAGALLAAGTSFLIPGVGLVIAGPVAGAIAGLSAGGVTGGIIGALVGAGIPEERAKLYHEALKNGSIMLTVVPHNEEDVARLTRKWADYKADVSY